MSLCLYESYSNTEKIRKIRCMIIIFTTFGYLKCSQNNGKLINYVIISLHTRWLEDIAIVMVMLTLLKNNMNT